MDLGQKYIEVNYQGLSLPQTTAWSIAQKLTHYNQQEKQEKNYLSSLGDQPVFGVRSGQKKHFKTITEWVN